MKITLEQVETLRKKVNCDYQLAEKALRKSKGNIDDAILYLKKRENRKFHKVFVEIEDLFHKLLSYNLIIFKNNRSIIHIPVFFLIGIVFVFNFSIELLIIIGILAAFSNLQFEIIDKQNVEQNNNDHYIKMTSKKAPDQKPQKQHSTNNDHVFKSEEKIKEKLYKEPVVNKHKANVDNKSMDHNDNIDDDDEFNEIIIE